MEKKKCISPACLELKIWPGEYTDPAAIAGLYLCFGPPLEFFTQNLGGEGFSSTFWKCRNEQIERGIQLPDGLDAKYIEFLLWHNLSECLELSKWYEIEDKMKGK